MLHWKVWNYFVAKSDQQKGGVISSEYSNNFKINCKHRLNKNAKVCEDKFFHTATLITLDTTTNLRYYY